MGVYELSQGVSCDGFLSIHFCKRFIKQEDSKSREDTVQFSPSGTGGVKPVKEFQAKSGRYPVHLIFKLGDTKNKRKEL